MGTLILAGLASQACAQMLSMQSDPGFLARTALGERPGAAAVGIWRNGAASYGFAGESDEKPIFEIGSISKVFTGLLVAQAVERRELALDDTLGKLLDKQAALRPNVAAITVRQLVTHTSCLPRLPANFQQVSQADNPYRGYDRARLWAALSSFDLTTPGPCPAEYSNFGFAVAGEALALRLKKPWAQLVEERIARPLGMRDTAQLHTGARAARLAPAYNGQDAASAWDFQAFAGAGALRSTPEDMLLFSRAVLAGRKGPLGAAAERLVQPLARFQGGEIGYGILISGPPERRTYAHGGATGAFRADWMLLPDTQEALVVLASNSHAPVSKASADILAARYGIADSRIDLDTGKLPAYAGVFRIDAKSAFTFVAQDQQLYGRLTGQPFAVLTPAAPDVFTFPKVGAEFTFTRQDGKVAAVTLRQRGAVIPAQRGAEAAPSAAVDRAATQQVYGGKYKLAAPPLTFEVWAVGGQLSVKLNEQPTLPVFPVAGKPDRYAYDVVPAEIQFTRNAGGQVEALVLYQNGARLRAERQEPQASDALETRPALPDLSVMPD